jgi:hypothetical protein
MVAGNGQRRIKDDRRVPAQRRRAAPDQWVGPAARRSIGRYAVAPDGTLTALGTTLVENNPASHPIDEGVSTDQNYLHVVANGLSQIVGYQVGVDGSLTQVTTAPVAAGSVGLGAS